VDDLQRGLCRDRGDLHGAAGLVADEDWPTSTRRGVRIAVSAPLGLRALAGEQHQERHADADQRPSTAPFNKFVDEQARGAGGGCGPGLFEGPSRSTPNSRSSTASSPPCSRRSAATKPAAEGAPRYLAEFVEKAKKSGLGRKPDRESTGVKGPVGRAAAGVVPTLVTKNVVIPERSEGTFKGNGKGPLAALGMTSRVGKQRSR